MLKDRLITTDEIAARRQPPRFFVADQRGEVIVCSPSVDGPVLERSLRVLLASLTERLVADDMWLERLDDETMLRLVPLRQHERRVYAVFVEPVKRDGLATAIKRFSLTRRERDVLEGLIQGLTNAAIAKRLFITEATVGEHVKNLLRKTGTNKRSEMIGRIFHDVGGGKASRR